MYSQVVFIRKSSESRLIPTKACTCTSVYKVIFVGTCQTFRKECDFCIHVARLQILNCISWNSWLCSLVDVGKKGLDVHESFHDDKDSKQRIHKAYSTLETLKLSQVVQYSVDAYCCKFSWQIVSWHVELVQGRLHVVHFPFITYKREIL